MGNTIYDSFPFIKFIINKYKKNKVYYAANEEQSLFISLSPVVGTSRSRSGS